MIDLGQSGLLDVVLGYDCNLGCDYCTITAEMRTRALTPGAVVRALRTARDDGFEAVSFTGGEPTIRPELLALVREARRLGFEHIKIQSNGLLFTESNIKRLVFAGVTQLHVSIHTHDAERYESKVRRTGTYAAMELGLRTIVAHERAHEGDQEGAQGAVRAHADLIIDTTTMHALPDAIRWLAERGVLRAQLWYVSLTDQNYDHLHLLPRMKDALAFVHEAFDVAREQGLELRSLHIPRCLLGRHADRAFDPGAGRVRVVSPDATFDLKDAPLTPGTHVAACTDCEYRTSCPGIRRDYLEVFGDAEIAEARGQTGSLEPTRTVLPVLD